MRTVTWMSLFVSVAVPTVAFAGRGSSNGALQEAIASNSPDAIVSEVERAEKLACLSCIETVMPLLDHPDARVRDAAAWWLGKRGVRDQVRDAAFARLQGRDATLARHGAETLGRLRSTDAVPALARYLANPLDEPSAMAAARALGRIGHASAIPALKAAVVGAKWYETRASALVALREVRGGTDASGILAALSDAEEEVRTEAVYTIAALGDRSGVAALMATVGKDTSAEVRKHACWALGQLGDATAMPALSQAVNDPDPLVRSMARVAISRIQH